MARRNDSSSTLSIEIGGTAVGTEYDQVAVTGTVSLASTLSSRSRTAPASTPGTCGCEASGHRDERRSFEKAVAEGEEPGSNILFVVQRKPTSLMARSVASSATPDLPERALQTLS
jgi:hypothetical protein